MLQPVLLLSSAPQRHTWLALLLTVLWTLAYDSGLSSSLDMTLMMASVWAVVDRIMIYKNIYILAPVNMFPYMDFADVIKLRTLRWGNYLGLAE